jgi:putative transposase
MVKKKSMELTLMEKKKQIDIVNPLLSVREQCNLLGLNRASFYYQPKAMDAYNLELMQLIDEQYTKTPFYGVPRMTAYLKKMGHLVNHKRIERLMALMGISAIYPKPKLSVGNAEHKIYPYLLRDLEITTPNQVWCSDITFIKLLGGFIYLVAIMDWFSRFVLSWNISNTITADFCVHALKEALMLYGKPDIFNSDQGSQFTSEEFTSVLLDFNVKISMDGRGRCWDNIFIERLWRSVKYEEVYLNDYQDVPYAKERLGNYFNFYDYERLHQSLEYKTPYEVYKGTIH